ncbi:AAA family ATPase [Longispora albida]|uniref:AAA family ATPase n=1 Tax=Longispora albida TaxID=203523 RepID=UPI000476D5D6|nr:ATP-binding protein [Longispora albida]
MKKPAEMFDRDHEWAALSRFVSDEQPGATLGVVSGRRRQGKTFLLDAVAREAGGFFFSAAEATEAESLRRLGETLAAFLRAPGPLAFESWHHAIEALLRLGAERPVPVVLDEFPYLVKASPALPSIIQGAYRPLGPDRTGSRARLLLCGSAMSFMGSLLAGNAPLRGRAGLELVVHTLDHRLAAQFWGIGDPRLALMTNAIVGGTPAYRTEFLRGDTPADLDDFGDWVVRAVLNSQSPLFREARYLLAEEPDIRDSGLFHSVLAGVAEGNSTRGGIANYLGRKATDIAHPLNVLEGAGLLIKEADVFRDNRTTYRIAEPLVTFHHSIMRPAWSLLDRTGNAEQVWRMSQRRLAGSVLGPHFEWICREWALRYSGGFFGDLVTQVGSGVVNDPSNKTSHEVDVAVVGYSDGGKPPLLSIGEAKWQERMGMGHLERLRRIRTLLSGSTRYDTSGTRLACYSGAGFTPELVKEAESGAVDLVDLNQLYGLPVTAP